MLEVSGNVRLALSGLTLPVNDVVAGLGGRAITKASLRRLFGDAIGDRLGRLHFLDLDWDVVRREQERV